MPLLPVPLTAAPNQNWTAGRETGTHEIHARFDDAPDDEVDRSPCSVFNCVDDEEVDDTDDGEDETTVRC